ncbi:MAG: dihydroorotate dehydrogenase [Candidatus Marinimicrobia bacterium]|nr:dihydroorotate dehydrogenase [Candidatus Neomarinimicrobiota bacterium]MBL7059755.1 dihydroorotate dehydrogenase [Candidatus Neomarinimicrobiota bacterium]
MTDLRIKIGDITFSNPVFTASGTFGYGTEVSDLTDVSKLGAIVTKSVTLFPREGNPPPRVVETPAGMINSIGLANVGVERYIREMIPLYDNIGTKVIMNIAGTTLEEYCDVLEKVEVISSNICGYEINISCPNVKKGGMQFGVDSSMTEALTAEMRKRTERLIIMKLSPNVTDITSIAKAAENGGADAVSAINTVVGMSIDSETGKSQIYTTYGGLSGPAIKPIGLATVHKVYQSVNIPVIGLGGITTGLDAVEYLLAGAVAVQVGTATFRHADAGEQIINELHQFGDSKSIEKISSLTGAVKTYTK